jgi:hypothetical protein
MVYWYAVPLGVLFLNLEDAWLALREEGWDPELPGRIVPLSMVDSVAHYRSWKVDEKARRAQSAREPEPLPYGGFGGGGG